VFDGSVWVVMSISNHGSLSGIGAGDHHDRYSDAEASSAAPVQSVNGQTGAVSVDSPNSTQSASQPGGYQSVSDHPAADADRSTTHDFNPNGSLTVTFPSAVPADGFLWSFFFEGSADASLTVYYANGSVAGTDAVSNVYDGHVREIAFPEGRVEEVSVSVSGASTGYGNTNSIRTLQPHVMALPSHSHTI
jgi:hypothetical protein